MIQTVHCLQYTAHLNFTGCKQHMMRRPGTEANLYIATAMFGLSPTALCLLNLDISKFEHVTVTLRCIVLPNAQHSAINIHHHQPAQEHTGMSLSVHIDCVYIYIQFIMSVHCLCSLVPRILHSGTQTMKLCRSGEPGIFCHGKH